MLLIFFIVVQTVHLSKMFMIAVGKTKHETIKKYVTYIRLRQNRYLVFKILFCQVFWEKYFNYRSENVFKVVFQKLYSCGISTCILNTFKKYFPPTLDDCAYSMVMVTLLRR
jgi:hypothetical protein